MISSELTLRFSKATWLSFLTIYRLLAVLREVAKVDRVSESRIVCSERLLAMMESVLGTALFGLQRPPIVPEFDTVMRCENDTSMDEVLL